MHGFGFRSFIHKSMQFTQKFNFWWKCNFFFHISRERSIWVILQFHIFWFRTYMQVRLFLLRFLSVYIMYHKTNSTRNGIEFGLILKIQSFNFVSLESSKNWFNLDSFIQLIFQYDIQGGFKSVVIWLFFYHG